MSSDEEKAIEKLKWYFEDCMNLDIAKYTFTILNLIKKQQEEIEKKDMIIDRMTIYIMKNSSVPTLRHRFCPNYEKEECRINCKDTIMKSKCIIEYFTKKVEGKTNDNQL